MVVEVVVLQMVVMVEMAGDWITIIWHLPHRIWFAGGGGGGNGGHLLVLTLVVVVNGGGGNTGGGGGGSGMYWIWI